MNEKNIFIYYSFITNLITNRFRNYKMPAQS